MTRGSPQPRRAHSRRSDSRRGRWPGAAARTAIALFLAAGPAFAQTGNEPIVFGQREKQDPFTLYQTRAELELDYRYAHDSRKPAGQPRQNFTENRFEQTFTLETMAAIVHPNLVELDLAGTFGLTQSFNDTDGDDETNYGTVLEYDLQATFLRKEDAVFTLYARRSQNSLNREFGPTLDNVVQTEGAILDWRNIRVPSRFEAFHSDQSQSGIDDVGTEFELSQNAFLWHSEYRPSSSQVWTWDYALNQIDSQTTGQPSDNYVTNDAVLTHSWDFGYQQRSNLASTIIYFNQAGDFPFERFRWDERLRWVHSDTFETDYRYTFEHQDATEETSDTNRGHVGFIHRLYKSLVTSAWVEIENIAYSDGSDSLTTSAHLDFDYRKSVPQGTLGAFLAFNFSVADNSTQTAVRQVIDDRRIFVDPFPIVLTQDGIIVSSIRITDTRNLIVYTEGSDYTVSPPGRTIEISRVVGGRIADGQIVLIDYQIEPANQNTVTTNSYSVGARYDFERGPLRGLGVYSRFTDQHQTIDADDSFAFTPNSYTDTVIGADYRIWKFQLGAEQEWYDSTLYPYDATRFFVRYLDRWTMDTTGLINTTYTILKYPRDDNRLDMFTVSGQISHRFTRELWGFATVTYRYEDDRDNGLTKGLDEQIELNWSRRQTTVFVLVRNSNLDTDFQDTNFQLFRVGIRREF